MEKDNNPPQPHAPWLSWQARCRQLGLPVEAPDLARFETLYAMLIDANRQVNLTRITDLDDYLNRHLLESLRLSPFLEQNARVADIGSGGGFPALPLAVYRPDLDLHAVEAVGKKCRFIESVKDALALENLQIHDKRAEDMARDAIYRDSFDFVTARAVAALPVLLEITLPLLKPGGVLLALKGERYQDELAQTENALAALHGTILGVEENYSAAGGVLLRVEKTAPTPEAYPRKAGLPQKKPL